MKAKQLLAGAVRVVVLLLSACTANVPPPPVAPLPGSVQMNQHNTKDYTGGAGLGSVFFDGTLYHFAVGGLGVDGSAIALMQLTGEVSHLDAIRQFPGVYRLASRGETGSDIWLRNENGVVLHLIAPPGSRMPQLENDGVQVRMDR